MCLIWGLTWFFLKYSLVEMPLFAGLSIRFLSAGIIFLSIHLIRKKKILVSRKMLLIYLQYGLINFSLCYFLTYWGAKYVFSNLGAILWSLLPLFVAGMAHFCIPDDRLNLRKALGMLIGLFGAILLLTQGENLGEGEVTLGLLAILLSVFLAAWPNVYLKMQNEKVDSYHLNGFGMSFAGLVFSVFYFFYERGQTIPLDFNNVGAVFFLTVPGTVLTWGIYIWLFNYLPVTQISYTAFYPPIVASFVGWLFLGESLPFIAIVGSAMIIAGGYLVVSKKRPKKALN
jgi:drug/metabolite transporter (DMT)-like permease